MEIKRDFVLRALETGANVSALCREFGVSRNCGYKWIRRFRERGIAGLQELSRRPSSFPVETSGETVVRILELRSAHPRWGPKKLQWQLARELGPEGAPRARTVARVLQRCGAPRLRRPKKRRAVGAAEGAPVVEVNEANDLWTVDLKGWWRTRDGARCEPLTVRDARSRDVLAARVMRTTRTREVRKVFERLFEQHGLPKTIQVDNGSPFASTSSRAGLTRLSAWWVSLGIRVVRGRPAHPQDNGGHERMHRDIAEDLEAHPEATLEAQQRALDEWVFEFNHVRPHEALGGRTPAELYRRSARPYRGPRAPRYPARFERRRVSPSGHFGYHGERVFVGSPFGGSTVALEYVDESTRRLWYYEVDLGLITLPRPVSPKRVKICNPRHSPQGGKPGRNRPRGEQPSLSPLVHEVSPMS